MCEQQVHHRRHAQQMEGGDGVDGADVSPQHGGKCNQMPLMISQLVAMFPFKFLLSARGKK